MEALTTDELFEAEGLVLDAAWKRWGMLLPSAFGWFEIARKLNAIRHARLGAEIEVQDESGS